MEPLQDEPLILNEHMFRKTTWNGVSVIQDMGTGYYNVTEVCKANRKQFSDWKKNVSTIEHLEEIQELYGLRLNITDQRILCPEKNLNLTGFLI